MTFDGVEGLDDLTIASTADGARVAWEGYRFSGFPGDRDVLLVGVEADALVADDFVSGSR